MLEVVAEASLTAFQTQKSASQKSLDDLVSLTHSCALFLEQIRCSRCKWERERRRCDVVYWNCRRCWMFSNNNWRRDVKQKKRVVLNFITVFKTSRSRIETMEIEWNVKKKEEEEKWKVVTKLENDFNYYYKREEKLKETVSLSKPALFFHHHHTYTFVSLAIPDEISLSMCSASLSCSWSKITAGGSLASSSTSLLQSEPESCWALKAEKMPKLSFYDDYDYNEQITIIVLREARNKKVKCGCFDLRKAKSNFPRWFCFFRSSFCASFLFEYTEYTEYTFQDNKTHENWLWTQIDEQSSGRRPAHSWS